MCSEITGKEALRWELTLIRSTQNGKFVKILSVGDYHKEFLEENVELEELLLRLSPQKNDVAMHIEKLATQVEELKHKWKNAKSLLSKHKRAYDDANARLLKFKNGQQSE